MHPAKAHKASAQSAFFIRSMFCSLGCFPQTRSSFVRHVFQKVAGLAVEMLADRFQRREAEALHLTGLEQGEIGFGDSDSFGEFVGADLALGEHDIETDEDRHQTNESFSCSIS